MEETDDDPVLVEKCTAQQFPDNKGGDGPRNIGLLTINPLKTKRIYFI
jgi:hypothetical protein